MSGEVGSEEFFRPGCPWWDLRTTWGAPNQKWCEATLCAWVNEPANAWSNVAYLVVAVWCLRRWRSTGNRAMGRFAGTTGLVGVCSFLFHATNNFATQLLDFLGMFVLVFLLLTLNLRRAGLLPGAWVGRAHIGLTGGCLLLLPVLRQAHFPYQLVVLFAVLGIVALETWLAWRGARGAGTRDFWVAVGLMGAAALCSVADLARWACDPDNHWLQGHALWHGLSALALLFAARHYALLEPGAPEASPKAPAEAPART